jgi:hypothetical protein
MFRKRKGKGKGKSNNLTYELPNFFNINLTYFIKNILELGIDIRGRVTDLDSKK